MKIKGNTDLLGALALLLIFIATSCNKNKDLVSPEEDSWPLTLSLGDSIALKVQIPSNLSYTKSEWRIDDAVVSNDEAFTFKKYKAGIYEVEYIAYNDQKVFSKKASIEVLPYMVQTTAANSMFANQLFEYHPAPGQFINKSEGDLASAKSVLAGKTGLVSLGAFGGYIVLGFEKPVVNKDGDDFVIYNNAFADFAEPGVVWVMEDSNANGLPDDTWYELKGSEYGKSGYIRNYSVTYTKPNPLQAEIPWKDNLGKSGTVKVNHFNKQSYFPLWANVDEYTLTGTLLPSIQINLESVLNSTAFEKGYADNAIGKDSFDIADAIDEKGNSVILKNIKFIKVQTGILADLKSLGELSTEIKGVEGLSF